MMRLRFAPSPTGYMHIGNLRTALYEYLLARSYGGKLILRIEDTDMERQVEGAVEVIYDSLKLAGIEYDEGPDKGGEYGPYVQSHRLPIYKEHADMLISKGMAYPCFCSKERLDSLKLGDQFAGYDRHCASLDPEQVAERLKREPYVIRQRIPSGRTSIHDEVFGEISVDNSELEDQVLIKADGYPTYNFANVVDDHLMEITHVVRGTEYLSSAPKYTLLYHAFGWDVPKYIHLPPVLGEGGAKLSKRKGDASFNDLVDMGFLPEAIVNYIVLLGWSPGKNPRPIGEEELVESENENKEREIFSLEELERIFSISGLSKSPASFDIVKLRWMNSEYFKKMSSDVFFDMALPYILVAVGDKRVDTKNLAEIVKPRIETLFDIEEMLGFINNIDDYDTSLFLHKKMKTTEETSIGVLQDILPMFEDLISWGLEGIKGVLESYIAQKGLKNGQVFWPLRTALSGRASSPCGAPELAELLGQQEASRRIRIAIEKLSVKKLED